MNSIITTKVRVIKNRIIIGTSFPNNPEKFEREISVLDVDSLDEIGRSIKAYKIFSNYSDWNILRRFIIFVYNLICFVSLLLFLIVKKKPQQTDASIVYYMVSNNMGILPPPYENNRKIQKVHMGEGLYLDKSVRRILWESAYRSFGSVGLLSIELLALANYAYIRHRYNPIEIVTSYESSPVCSVLTYYCHLNFIKHTNIMHGEKLLSQNNVLGFFDKMYVWDGFYQKLFEQLKYKTSDYIIYNPWIAISLPKPKDVHDMTYYLNMLNNDDVNCLINQYRILLSKGFKVKIRLHPSQYYDDIKKKMEKYVELEDNEKVSILQSLADTKYCISEYSTVLFQGFCYGKAIIIDNIMKPNNFQMLQKTNYIMLRKPHHLLSDFIN